MLDDMLLDAEDRMGKAVEFFSKEVASVRTGRANPALIENVKVDYYGTFLQAMLSYGFLDGHR